MTTTRHAFSDPASQQAVERDVRRELDAISLDGRAAVVRVRGASQWLWAVRPAVTDGLYPWATFRMDLEISGVGDFFVDR